jgi:hypothetical protein
MTSASSSKNEKDLTFSFGDTGSFPTPQADMSMLLWLYERWLICERKVLSSDPGPAMRKLAGGFACVCVAFYVAGATCRRWLAKIASKVMR